MSSLFSDWLAGQGAEPTNDPAPAADAPSADAAPSEVTAGSAADSGRSAETTAAPAKPAKAARAGSDKIVLDTQLAAASDIARSAIAEVAGSSVVGEHLGALAEGTRLVTHYFACTDPTYRGWRWVAVLARAPRAKKVTVCETALLPGPDSLVAPEWVPWEQRLEPGDLTPRDTLPKVEDDPNLQQGFEQLEETSDGNLDEIPNFEFGLGRRRVLSPEGISAAASRWAESETGAESEFAAKASAHCSSCGYLMPLAGSLRQKFGVCANGWSPADGKVVALDFGCGAHSETDVRRQGTDPAEAVVDDYSAGELEFQEG
ncbi:DUF3027 domain-containing protein [Brevibacterium marinum]|uniref:DUF3027 domain-containing protein n=1 Tax=Brevibacterium marinum TaxID=418643 RepID=A0A846RR71_9MICO|nr:DUF3027 domain-containing protein [Brevibacterium marinum]NJC56249.1 hypothetical protein [Brevibacterium marinum]